MKSNKLLTTLAIVSLASVALFTGCNDKINFEGNQSGHGDQSLKSLKLAQTTSPVDLGTAANFAVLGATSVTNATTSVITGDLGVSPGTSITGFSLSLNTIVGSGVTDGAGIVNGTIYSDGPVAAQAHNDAQIAYDYLMAQVATPANTYTGVTQLDGLTFTPGVYNFGSANLLAGGKLYLDFGGDPNALFIFQTSTTLVTMSNSNIIALNPPTSDCLGANVFWAVGSSATIDGDQFIGTVIAYTMISMTNTDNASGFTNVAGRMLALGANVTMVNSIISTCGTSVGGKHNPKPCRDFVTGGGWITDANGDKATFGVSGGIKNTFWGHLSFNDHNGTSIKSTQVTGYTYINATTRQIKGWASVNGEGSFPYTVTVTDNGEPGRADVFSIVLVGANVLTSYSASGTLTGGNIQLHKECGDKKDGHEKDLCEFYNDKDENDGHNNCDNNKGGDKDNHGGDKDNHGGDKDNHGGDKDNHSGNVGHDR